MPSEIHSRSWPWMAIGVSVAVALALAIVSPADTVQGELVRIMYVHVPAAWLAYLAFGVTLVGSVGYLVTRRLSWDRVAASSAEIGVYFTGLAIGLGMIWAKPTWGVWWTWDPRLTSTALLLAVFVGYLAIRGFADDPDSRARWSAIVGILGFLQVPIVYLSVVWWRTLHQPPSSPRSVSSEILWTWMLNFVAFLLMFAYLVAQRVRLAHAESELEALEAYDV